MSNHRRALTMQANLDPAREFALETDAEVGG